MAYVNEYISAEDIDKYGIKEIDRTHFLGGNTRARDWTVDRERGRYLRHVSTGREERSHVSEWTFLCDGQLFLMELSVLSAKANVEGLAGHTSAYRELDYSTTSNRFLFASNHYHRNSKLGWTEYWPTWRKLY